MSVKNIHPYYVHIVITSEMIHHHGASLSKQQTATCHGTQQGLSPSTVKPNMIMLKSSPEIAKCHICQPFLQLGQLK